MLVSNFNTFKRQLFWEAVLNLCQNITLANGYNTQPFVTDDPRKSQSTQEAFTLLVVQGSEVVLDVGVGGCMDLELTIEVLGYARSKDDNPTLQLNKLIQDLRNAIAVNLGGICDYVNAGAALSFGDLETDSGVLTMDGLAAFSLPLVFTYKSGPTW